MSSNKKVTITEEAKSRTEKGKKEGRKAAQGKNGRASGCGQQGSKSDKVGE